MRCPSCNGVLLDIPRAQQLHCEGCGKTWRAEKFVPSADTLAKYERVEVDGQVLYDVSQEPRSVTLQFTPVAKVLGAVTELRIVLRQLHGVEGSFNATEAASRLTASIGLLEGFAREPVDARRQAVALSTLNTFGVTAHQGQVVSVGLRRAWSREEALQLAAWLVVGAELADTDLQGDDAERAKLGFERAVEVVGKTVEAIRNA